MADRVVVLRLGRNNGVFDVATVSAQDIVAAITGATDNAVTRRTVRRATHADQSTEHPEGVTRVTEHPEGVTRVTEHQEGGTP